MISVFFQMFVYEIKLAKLQQIFMTFSDLLLCSTSSSRDSEYLNLSHKASTFHIIAMCIIVARQTLFRAESVGTSAMCIRIFYMPSSSDFRYLCQTEGWLIFRVAFVLFHVPSVTKYLS
jgi:hypothetical protein